MAVAQAQIRPPEGPPRAYEASDHGLHAHDSRNTLEEWAFEAALDDGSHLYVTYLYSSLWFLPPLVALEISVVPAEGDPIVYGGRGPASGFKYDSASARLRFGPEHWVEGLAPGQMRLKAQSDWHGGIEVELSFSGALPGFVVGDGWFRVGDDPDARVRSMVMTPGARVTGSIRRNGAAQEVAGWGAGQHNYYARLPSTMFERRQVAHGRAGELALSMVAWKARQDRGGDTGGYLVVVGKGGATVHSSTGLALDWPRSSKVRGCAVPLAYVVTGGPEGKQARVGGAPTRRLQSYALTDNMQPITAAAVRAAIGEPIIVRSTGALEVELPAGRRAKGQAMVRIDCAGK